MNSPEPVRVGMSEEAAARIEAAKLRRREHKRWLKANKARIDAEWDALPDGRLPSAAQARAEMGEERWKQLNEEWETP